MRLAFFLGRTPALSLAEIQAVCAHAGASLHPLGWSRDVLIAEVEGLGDPESVFARLAGVIKIAEMTVRIPHAPCAEDVRELLPATARKIFFGISAYTLDAGAVNVQTRKLGLAVKRLLDEEEKSSRFVTSQEDALSAVVISTNKLLSERGAEIVVVSVREGSYLGRTVWVQPYREFADHDIGRPERDVKAGMLPPKLARIMVNLALDTPQPHDASTFALLDPFCGSGTIVQEAALLGVKRLIGTDRDGNAIKRTHANAQWLSAFAPAMRASDFSITLTCVDVSSLPIKLGLGAVDVVVTEPYMGPPRTRLLGDDEAHVLKDELQNLYRSAFNSFARVLKPGGRMVMIWPVFVGRGRLQFLDLENDAKNSGFIVVDPLMRGLPSKPDEGDGYLLDRHSLLYQREDQFVLREIRVFDKKESQ